MSAPPAFCRCAGGRASRSEGHKDLHRRPRAGGRQRSRRRSRRDRHLRRSIRRGGPIQRSRGHGSVLGLLAAPAPRTSSGRPIGIGTSLSSVARCRRRPNGRCRVRSIDDCAHWPQGARLGPRVRCGCARLDDRWVDPRRLTAAVVRCGRRDDQRAGCIRGDRAVDHVGRAGGHRDRPCGHGRGPAACPARRAGSARARRRCDGCCRCAAGGRLAAGPRGCGGCRVRGARPLARLRLAPWTRATSTSPTDCSGPPAPGAVAIPVCSARWSLLEWRPLWWGCWRSSLLSCRVSPQTAGRRRAWPSEPSSAPRRSGHSWWSWR